MNTTSNDVASTIENLQKQQQEKILQVNKGEEQEPTGGYVAIYHDIEEICYGPELGLSAKERVFLCLRHKLLRDGLCQKLIGKSFIVEKTKLSPSQVECALKSLEQKEIILVHRSKTGKVWNQNEYELHPKKFGKLYNWYKNNPTVRVYQNGKSGSYSKRGVPSNLGVGVPSDSGVGVPFKSGVGRELRLTELLSKSLSNNPSSNNPKKRTLKKSKDIFSSQEMGPEEVENEKRRQLAEARKAGIL